MAAPGTMLRMQEGHWHDPDRDTQFHAGGAFWIGDRIIPVDLLTPKVYSSLPFPVDTVVERSPDGTELAVFDEAARQIVVWSLSHGAERGFAVESDFMADMRWKDEEDDGLRVGNNWALPTTIWLPHAGRELRPPKWCERAGTRGRYVAFLRENGPGELLDANSLSRLGRLPSSRFYWWLGEHAIVLSAETGPGGTQSPLDEEGWFRGGMRILSLQPLETIYSDKNVAFESASRDGQLVLGHARKGRDSWRWVVFDVNARTLAQGPEWGGETLIAPVWRSGPSPGVAVFDRSGSKQVITMWTREYGFQGVQGIPDDHHVVRSVGSSAATLVFETLTPQARSHHVVGWEDAKVVRSYAARPTSTSDITWNGEEYADYSDGMTDIWNPEIGNKVYEIGKYASWVDGHDHTICYRETRHWLCFRNVSTGRKACGAVVWRNSAPQFIAVDDGRCVDGTMDNPELEITRVPVQLPGGTRVSPRTKRCRGLLHQVADGVW